MTAVEIAKGVQSGQSAEGVVLAALERARAASDLNIFLSFSELALEQARALDARRARGEALGALAGVPVALKDNLCLKGSRTTAGSKILEDFVAPYTASAVQRLIDADAIIIGKVNLDEFGMGSSGENSAFGPTKNPRHPAFVPGGSSSGSASSVAAGIVPIALGTDTGGSIRLPAAFTGTLGIKPTYGRVSRYGVVALASSLDQVGGFALRAHDLALTMDLICAHDPLDATSLPVAENAFVASLGRGVKGLRVGLVREALGAGNSPGVEGAMASAMRELEALGASLKEVSLPSLEYGLAAYYLVMCSEASSNLARYDGMVYSKRQDFEAMDVNAAMAKARGQGFGPEVLRRILMGTYALSSGYYDAFYSKALKARARIAAEFAALFADVDVLMLPTAPSPAFRFGEKSDPMSMYLSDVDTVAVNLAGLPALSLPYGFEDAGRYSSSAGLPVGVQLIAPVLGDERLLSVAQALEQASDAAFCQPTFYRPGLGG